MKNIPVERAYSENLEACFDVLMRSREMLRGVDNTRNFAYCHCMARMVSYPGVTCTVRLRLKEARRQKRPGAGVYACSVKEKREQLFHSVCSSLYGQVRIVVV